MKKKILLHVTIVLIMVLLLNCVLVFASVNDNVRFVRNLKMNKTNFIGKTYQYEYTSLPGGGDWLKKEVQEFGKLVSKTKVEEWIGTASAVYEVEEGDPPTELVISAEEDLEASAEFSGSLLDQLDISKFSFKITKRQIETCKKQKSKPGYWQYNTYVLYDVLEFADCYTLESFEPKKKGSWECTNKGYKVTVKVPTGYLVKLEKVN